jgi:hypothetical protein
MVNQERRLMGNGFPATRQSIRNNLYLFSRVNDLNFAASGDSLFHLRLCPGNGVPGSSVAPQGIIG